MCDQSDGIVMTLEGHFTVTVMLMLTWHWQHSQLRKLAGCQVEKLLQNKKHCSYLPSLLLLLSVSSNDLFMGSDRETFRGFFRYNAVTLDVRPLFSKYTVCTQQVGVMSVHAKMDNTRWVFQILVSILMLNQQHIALSNTGCRTTHDNSNFNKSSQRPHTSAKENMVWIQITSKIEQGLLCRRVHLR